MGVRRARRELADAGVPCAALAPFVTFDPRAVAGFVGAGLGAAGVASGPAVGAAVSRAAAWGEHERARMTHLPRHVLVSVTDRSVEIYAWHHGKLGPKVATWERQTFHAMVKTRWIAGQVDVRVEQPDGKHAWLTGKGRRTHGRARSAASAIVKIAAPQLSGGGT